MRRHRQLFDHPVAVPCGVWNGMTTRPDPRYAGCRHPAEIIAAAVWLDFRFPLGLRMVEALLAARGITVSDVTVRRRARKSGPGIATRLRRRAARRGDKWPLNEVVLDHRRRQSSPVAGRRSGRLRARRAGPEPARYPGGQAFAAQVAEEAGPGAAGADHRQAEVRRRRDHSSVTDDRKARAQAFQVCAEVAGAPLAA